MRYLNVVPMIAAVLFGACGRGGGAAPTPRPLGPVPIEAQVAIRDAATLQDIWRRATSTQSSPPPAPTVDFERQMLLLVASGRMRSGDEIHVDSVGTRREVTAAGREQEVLAVQYTITEACSRLQRDTYPLEIVRVRRYQGDVRFIGKRARASSCR